VAASGLTACGGEKKDAKLTGGKPGGATTASANKTVSPRFASPEEICAKASPVVAKLAHISLTAARNGCVAEQDETGNPAVSWSFSETYSISVISDDKDGAGFKKVYENKTAPIPSGVRTSVVGNKYPMVSFVYSGLGNSMARAGNFDVEANIQPGDMPASPTAQTELWDRTTAFAQNVMPLIFAGANSAETVPGQPQPNMPPSPGSTDIPKVE
jgi:hypothetical protein